ncbi:MAG: hypothetical protein ABSF71_32425 [Terriglobia bacterium]|jgi:hypothetical protein
MVVPVLILVFSTALFFFYWQVTFQRILRQAIDEKYFQSVVAANRLEFPVLRKAFEELNVPVDYPRMRKIIKCDFLALTYLLKNAVNVNQHYSGEERLLIFYFRLVLGSLIARHWLRLREKPAVLELAAILQYFANIVGKRMSSVRLGNLTASDYLLSL